MEFQLLEFDTKLFNVGVAKILSPRFTLVDLQKTLEKLRAQNIHLVYWPSDSNNAISQQAAKTLGGIFCSEQITYLFDLKTLPQIPLVTPKIEAYQEKTPNKELEQLAFQAGLYCRFKMDPNFPKEWFLKVYSKWIENSVNGSIASKVIIIRDNKKIIAMATLGTKNNRGDIGLLAVNKNFRGKKLGVKLVHAALAYFIEQGFTQAQVVTQKANVPACKLYESCCFYQEKIENFYHFWL